MKTYTTLDQIFKDARSHKVTAQELLNGSSRVNDEWQEIKISDELKKQICIRLSEIFGGRKATQNQVYNTLMRDRRQHWGLSRTVISCYSGAAELYYIAGQDMPYECVQIRK